MSDIIESSDEIGSDAAQRAARRNPKVVAFGRIGWVAKGIVYGLTGVLALAIVFGSGRSSSAGGSSESGDSGEEASQSGALATIAESPAGTALLLVLAAGLVVYALWRIFTIVLPADNDAEGWLSRVGYGVSAFVYLALAWTALSIATAPSPSQQSSEDARVERITRQFMEMTGGRVMVFVAGAALLVIGCVFLWKSIDAGFTSQLESRGVGPVKYQHLVLLGRIGWVGRAGMMWVIGFFLCRAAVLFDPDEAQGLDGSLRKATDTMVGTVLVIVVGVGLVVYGVFCVLSAPRRKLVGADE